VVAINQAVDGLVAELKQALPIGAIDPEVAQATEEALLLLEASARQGGDAGFNDFVHRRAKELSEAFVQVRKAKAERKPPDEESVKRVASLAAEAAKEAAAREDAADDLPEFESFEQAYAFFLDTFLDEILGSFVITKRTERTPYLMRPDFGAAFRAAVQAHFVPEMLKNRRLGVIGGSLVKAEWTKARIYEQFRLKERENITVHLWRGLLHDVRDAALGRPLEDGDATSKPKLWGKSKSDPSTEAKTKEKHRRRAIGSAFWSALAADAEKHGYQAPEPADIDMFEALFLYDIDHIAGQKTALIQMLIQETDGGEGRSGASRDRLGWLMESTHPYLGELVAAWAYHAHPEYFTDHILWGFLAGEGTSHAQRQKRLPFFTRWIDCPQAPPD
jgi:hypothetical protein